MPNGITAICDDQLEAPSPHMTRDERATRLEHLRWLLQIDSFENDSQGRRDILAEIGPLLNFSPSYHTPALDAIQTLSSPFIKLAPYEDAKGRMDVLIGQAIHELQQVPPAPAQQSTPTFAMTDAHGPLWYWSHCTWRVRWTVGAVLLSAFALGFTAGRIHFFVKVYEAWTAAKP